MIDSLAACLTAGNPEIVAQLVTDRYLADAYGGGERMTKEDYIALAPLAPVVPVTIVSVGQIGLTASDTAAAAVVTIQGNQLRSEEWTFLFRRNRQVSATPTAGGEGHWLVHQVTVLTPAAPAGASEIDAELQSGAITVTPNSFDGPDVVVTIQNTSEETHEFLVLRLVEGATRTSSFARPATSSRRTSNSSGRKPCPPANPACLFSLISNRAPTRWSACCQTKTVCRTLHSEKPPRSPWSNESSMRNQPVAPPSTGTPRAVRFRDFFVQGSDAGSNLHYDGAQITASETCTLRQDASTSEKSGVE